MKRRLAMQLTLGVCVLSALFCGQNAQKATETPTIQTPEIPTPYPTPPPPATVPSELPESTDLQILLQYANELSPWLQEAGEIVQRDGEILQEVENGNEAALCEGRLEQDNIAMKAILANMEALSPPPDAAVIHDLLIESGDAWTEALDNVELYCETNNQLYILPAALKYWEAAAKLQDAANRFWLLIVAKGLEDWVQR
jgi:hypothetical protein